MATVYASSWTGSAATGKITQRAYLTYTVGTNNATSYSVSVTSGIQQWNGTWTKIGATCGLTSASSASKTLTHSGANYLHAFCSHTYSYTKGHSAQSVTIYATSKITSGVDSEHGSSTVLNKTSTVAYTITIPAKYNYAVTYNANGGTGAPASQTKWYNESLTLQADVPARAGYKFLGWATSPTATEATHQPSATYTDNAPLTLYAVWKQVVKAKVSGEWKDAEAQVKANGSWYKTDMIYVKVGNEWKSI